MGYSTILTVLLLVVSLLKGEEDIHLVGDFSAQVEQIVAHQTLSEEDYAGLFRAASDAQRAMYTRWKGSKLVPFGSLLNGLGSPQSDTDNFVDIPATDSYSDSITKLNEAEETMKQNDRFVVINKNVDEMTLKSLHIPTHREVHLLFNEPSVVSNTKLLSYYFNLHKEGWLLAVIIKYWSQVQKLYGDDLLHSYVLYNMVIFYLQQRHLFPSVAALQRNVDPVVVDHWNTAFNEIDFNRTSSRAELFDLLVGFFAYYSNFNYEELVISAYVGYPIKRERFEHASSLPSDFELYKSNVANNITEPIDLSTTICIQDPFEHNSNIIKVYDPILVERLRSALNRVYKAYQKNRNPDEFLSLMLDVPQEIKII